MWSTRSPGPSTMDQSQILPPMSLNVVMEEENYSNHRNNTNPITIEESIKLPATTHVEHLIETKRKSFVQSPSIQVYLESSLNYRKLDAAERRKLRAQLKGTAAVDTGRPRATENPMIAPENLKNPQNAPASLEAAENGESVCRCQKHVGVLSDGVRSDSTATTSTDSEMELSRNGDRTSTMTDTSRSSDDTKVETEIYEPLRDGIETTNAGCEESGVIAAAWRNFETSWNAQVAITDEEKQNGYRFTSEVDPAYLGFYPKETDKRKYLKAYPIVGPIPQATMGWNCSLPLTFGQWSFVVGFFVFFAALGVGAYLYLSRQTMAT